MSSSGGMIVALLLAVIGASAVMGMEYDYYRYHTMDEISSWMDEIVKANRDLVTMVEYGQTYEKRPIYLLKIGEKAQGITKKAIWMDCGIHAREWIAPAFCQYFVKQILDAYKTDAKMQEMMRNMDFYVTPVLNVDGYIYTWQNSTNRLWRKNRAPGPADCDCLGVDLNRNFRAAWGSFGVSKNCCSEIYPGSQALSEPEAQAVTYFVGPRVANFLCFLTIHSYSQLLLIPYGQYNDTAHNYQELMDVGLAAAEAIKKVHGMTYKVGTSPQILYNNSGSSRDWSHKQGIPLAYTFELRDNGTFGFELPEDQIQPACEEAYSGAMYIITYAHDKSFNGAVATAAATVWTVLLAVAVSGNTLV